MTEITVASNGKSSKLLFTGDIGRVHNNQIAPGKVVHSGPTEGEDCDLLVMESTYGNRLHPHTDPRPETGRADPRHPAARRQRDCARRSPSSGPRSSSSC